MARSRGAFREALAQRPQPSVLLAVAVAGCAAVACTTAITLSNGALADPYIRATLADWITVSYIFGGLLAWWRRPQNRFGPLMVGAGFINFLSSLAVARWPVPYTVGQVLDFLPAVVFLHVFLAYPSGRLDRRFEQIVVRGAYVIAIALSILRLCLGDTGAMNVLKLTDAPVWAARVLQWQLVTMSVLMVAGVGVLVARRRGSGRPLRRSLTVLVESFALGLVMIAVLYMSYVFDGYGVEPIRRATLFVIGLAPLAFVVGLLQARLARSAVGRLVVDLRANPAPADLENALARALRDPSLTLAYWLPQFGAWADLEGRPVVLPDGGSPGVTMVDREGEHVAALLHDSALSDEPELCDAVGAAAGIALENGRLQAELKARLEELQGSRARVIEAGQVERKRLERNLHDGAQQRLVALSLELSLLEERLGADGDAKDRLDKARQEIAASLEELRDVAQGLHPAVVTGHGLAIGLEQIASRATVPVRLSVKLASRLPEQIEVTAYYVVSESLANIAKHAHASSASIDVMRMNGRLVVEIVDDGVGGADTEGGSGLRGLADRVEALGGCLRVWTPRGGGTRVKAEIPCA